VIEPAGGVAAIITNESVKTLGLKEGITATALIKASHVMPTVRPKGLTQLRQS
jgi:molybdate transport system regulatory protein